MKEVTMQVSLSQKLNQPISIQNSTQLQTYNKLKANNTKDSLSFKSGGTGYLTYLIAKNGINAIQSGIKSKKIYNFKQEINAVLSNPQNSKVALPHVITALSKTPSGIDETFTYGLLTIMGNDINTIRNMKYLALDKLFPLTDDNVPINTVAKKELMNSLFNAGEYLSDDYINAFSLLSDKLYKHYKEDFIEKILYLDAGYKPTKEPEQYIYNLRLVQSLDKNIYGEFLESHKTQINNLKQIITNFAATRLVSKKNVAYQMYCHDFDYAHELTKFGRPADWKESSEEIFYSIVQQYGNNQTELAKKLNIDKECVEIILKDLNALYAAENTSDKEEQIRILTNRLDEKYNSDYRIGMLDYSDVSSRIRDEFEDSEQAETKRADILNFIKRTNIEEELKEIYKSKLQSLDRNVEKASDNYNRKYDREFWSGMP